MSTDAASHPNELPCGYQDDVCGENLLHMCHTCEALFVHESTVVYIGPGHVTAKHRGRVSMDI